MNKNTTFFGWLIFISKICGLVISYLGVNHEEVILYMKVRKYPSVT
jgi:hypothetical protein